MRTIVMHCMIGVLFGSTLIMVGCSKKPQIIKVKWHIKDVLDAFSDIKEQKIRDENRRRCVNFGLNDRKGCLLGVADIQVEYEDEKYKNIIKRGKLDWVVLPPFQVIEKNKSRLESQGRQGLINQIVRALNTDRISSQVGILSYTNPDMYTFIAGELNKNALFFREAAREYAHPRFIPAGWIIDKGVGDKIFYNAHGFTIEATIATMPSSENRRNFLKWLSWQKYIYDSRATIGTGFALLAIIWLCKR